MPTIAPNHLATSHRLGHRNCTAILKSKDTDAHADTIQLYILNLAILAVTRGLLRGTVLRPRLRLTALGPPNARTVIIPWPGQNGRGRWP